ncbi:DegT/DnrJ/EryC1/StrS family aminotransferase [Methylophaga sp. OBS1]|uniref:DegT/DnrJ/EryC1/StrS family aminotransferase n=1 Tax=Methylophaga sp. OBS1 TaxID=2991933 RepID=UPI00225393E7|nr:DegT/DnrJ/EryC1/StrS family aminotransferase [Methylophaga sp. OBS1]MCX4193381.1 DegT/DnrJ/EryC1/StrS family aminotransferase [Methylophaga sp. OBS1]
MKQIKTKTDLAINGAPPAFDEKLHVGRPNIGDKAEFLRYVDQIFESKWLSNNGPLVQQLEQRIAEHHHVKHCVAMANGTIALEIAIRALELKGEVIIPSYTFIATAHALHWQEITPVFADIDPATHCLEPESVRKMITPNTSGIIGVHLWGHAAPVKELQNIADEHNLKLMFDAAHAFGNSHKGQMIGNFGEAEVLSFHATKLFNTFEGGAVLTNNDELAEKMRLMRNFGFGGVDSVIYPGTNGKLTEICAAMGLVNLDNLDSVVEHNKSNYFAYNRGLERLPGISIFAFDEAEKNNYQYVVMEVDEACPVSRDDIVEALHAENILARKYFWPGCHNMFPYRKLYPHARLLLPVTEQISDKVVVLPTGTAVSAEIVNVITQVVETVVGGKS